MTHVLLLLLLLLLLLFMARLAAAGVPLGINEGCGELCWRYCRVEHLVATCTGSRHRELGPVLQKNTTCCAMLRPQSYVGLLDGHKVKDWVPIVGSLQQPANSSRAVHAAGVCRPHSACPAEQSQALERSAFEEDNRLAAHTTTSAEGNAWLPHPCTFH